MAKCKTPKKLKDPVVSPPVAKASGDPINGGGNPPPVPPK